VVESTWNWILQEFEKLNINDILGNWGSGAFGAFIFAVAGVAFVGLRKWAGHRINKARIPKAVGENYTILVACLEGDTDNRQRDHLLQSLETHMERGIFHIQPYPETLSIFEIKERSQSITDAEATGRKWLKNSGADLLVWGKVAQEDEVLRLRMLASEGGESESKGYVLTETLELSIDFAEELGAALEGIIVASVSSAYSSGTYVTDILKPAYKRLRNVTQNLPAKFTPISRGSIFNAHAMTALRLGEQLGDNRYLAEAITSYRAALAEWTRERVPYNWAMTQSNLGIALALLDERERKTARLEEAVIAYQEALKEWTPEQVPLGWASTQNNLGLALMRLGERENVTARFEEAVIAYQRSMEVWTRARMPIYWGATQNNLGLALAAIGNRECGTAWFEEAIIAYQEALTVWKREWVPINWAMAQHNLGLALAAIGNRECGTARLEEAVIAYQEALKEWTPERVPLYWEIAQNNLNLTLAEISNRRHCIYK